MGNCVSPASNAQKREDELFDDVHTVLPSTSIRHRTIMRDLKAQVTHSIKSTSPQKTNKLSTKARKLQRKDTPDATHGLVQYVENTDPVMGYPSDKSGSSWSSARKLIRYAVAYLSSFTT